jgi:hypothetical protein
VLRYAAQVRRRLEPGLSDGDVRVMVLGAGLQRLMQALGAYGFLGLVKGRRGFLAHVPRGLAHLRDVLGAVTVARREANAAAPWLPPALPALEACLARLDDDHVAARIAAARAAPGAGADH